MKIAVKEHMLRVGTVVVDMRYVISVDRDEGNTEFHMLNDWGVIFCPNTTDQEHQDVLDAVMKSGGLGSWD